MNQQVRAWVLGMNNNGPSAGVVRRNLANAVSILGVIPLCLLFLDEGYSLLVPLIVYTNIIDDLDGILARKLEIRSAFGADLDNVCDAITHSVFVMMVGIHHGGICAAFGSVATAAIVIRVVSRLDPTTSNGAGSPTNELIRHIFFILLLADLSGFDPTPYLCAAFLLDAVSMHVPFPMPYMVRSLAKSDTGVAAVNVALVAAWLVPLTTWPIATGFILAYLYSLVAGAACGPENPFRS